MTWGRFVKDDSFAEFFDAAARLGVLGILLPKLKIRRNLIMNTEFIKKWHKLLLILAVPFVVVGCSGSSTTNTTTVVTASGGSIQGVLKDASTQEPIAGAIIDVGTARATTNQSGQFTISNVAVATFPATIDLRSVTSPVNMANATLTPAQRYPNFAFQSLTAYNAAASSVAATSLVTLTVGKQASTITGVVTDATLSPVGSGYTVTLSSTATTPATVVNTTQTTATGNFTFTGVQSQGAYSLTAADSAGSFATPAASAVAVTSPVDGGTINKTVSVTSTNNQPPTVISVTPQHSADITPVANQTVVFTFSKPIKQTAVVSSTSPSNPSGLYSFVAVNFAGNKAIRASNIAHSLSWSTDRTQLTVTLPVVAVSATYVVDLCNAPLTDDAGLSVSGLGTACLALPPAVANATAGTAGKAYVIFTTNGGANAAAPTVVNITNSASLDSKKGAVLATLPSFSWLPVSGAKAYNIYRSTKQVWGGTVNTHPAVKLNATPLLSSNYTDTTLVDYVENGAVKLAYDYTVTSLNSDSIESSPSGAATAQDVIPPKLLQLGSSATVSSITLAFDEVVDQATAMNAANYNVSLTPALGAVAVVVPVASVTKNVNAAVIPNVVTGYTLNFAAGVTTANASTVTITGVTDIAGNPIVPTASHVLFSAGVAGIPY